MKNKTFAIRMTAAAVGIMMLAGICAGQSYWKRTYGGSLSDGANAITPTPDGNFIVAGYTSSFGNVNGDAYFLKIKPNGDTLWTKTYGVTNINGASAITPTPDGNFIAAGYTYSLGNGSGDAYLLKIKPDGDTLWTKTYGGTELDAADAITPTSDGNFIVTGETKSFGTGVDNDVYLLKIKPDGDTIWTKTYGGTNDDWANAITPTPDGNFIVAGYTHSFGSQSGSAYLLKIKPNGDTIWTKTYGGTSGGLAKAITPTPDGNFIIAGEISSPDGSNADVYLLKIKPDGDTIWTKTYGGTNNDLVQAITPTRDGDFMVAGFTYPHLPYGTGYNYYIYLLKINPSGDTLWTKTFGGTNAISITSTSDGNFIAAGNTTSLGTGDDVYLFSIIDDRYAKKDSLFTFKIPVYDTDSLGHGYTPLNVPSGMTVSLGGTISWTPMTDSAYVDYIEYLVTDDFGRKDTLTFNLFVNCRKRPIKVIDPVTKSNNLFKTAGISINSFSSYTSFSLPVPNGSLAIYDIHGRLVQNLSISNNTAIWRGKIPAGRYFARMTDGRREMVKSFVVVK
jgi:uncharacterized delta-60 repeat protein